MCVYVYVHLCMSMCAYKWPRVQTERGGMCVFSANIGKKHVCTDEKKKYTMYVVRTLSSRNFCTDDMINHERESLHSSIERNDAMMEAIKERLQRKEASEKHTFSFGSDERQIVDVYLPTTERSSNEDTVPLLIFLHGGAWVSENVGLYEDLARYISSKGIAVALPEYRLTRYKSTTKEDPNTIWHPNHIEDVYQGINIIFAKSKALGYSTNDTVLVGHSAGGWMNLTIAFDSTKANDKSSEPLVRNLPQIDSSFVKSIKSFVCVVSMM